MRMEVRALFGRHI